MKENVEVKIEGLKCDNASCNYRDDSVKREDYEKHINSECPKCGENLLTEADYNNVLILEQAVVLTNLMSAEEIEAFTGALNITDGQAKSFIVNLHGDITFREADE